MLKRADEGGDEDDFALRIFDKLDRHIVKKLQRSDEEDERWWIVMQPRVAVRPRPTMGSQLISVLPGSSVVRATGIEIASGTRWLRLHEDDIRLLDTKQRATSAEPCGFSSLFCGRFLIRCLRTKALRLHDDRVAGTRPAAHGGAKGFRLGAGSLVGAKAARRGCAPHDDRRPFGIKPAANATNEGGDQRLGLLAEISNECIDALLGAYDAAQQLNVAKPATATPMPTTATRTDTHGTTRVAGPRGAEDGLVDLSLQPPVGAGVASEQSSRSQLRDTSGRALQPQPQAYRSPRRSYVDIMRQQSAEQRAARLKSEVQHNDREAEESKLEEQMAFSRAARAHACSDAARSAKGGPELSMPAALPSAGHGLLGCEVVGATRWLSQISPSVRGGHTSHVLYVDYTRTRVCVQSEQNFTILVKSRMHGYRTVQFSTRKLRDLHGVLETTNTLEVHFAHTHTVSFSFNETAYCKHVQGMMHKSCK